MRGVQSDYVGNTPVVVPVLWWVSVSVTLEGGTRWDRHRLFSSGLKGWEGWGSESKMRGERGSGREGIDEE